MSVVIYHYTVYYTAHFAPDLVPAFVFKRGNLGVDLFFCISGFVIYMTLNECRDWKDFAVRRIARIYPAYAFCLILTFSVYSYSDLPKFHYGTADLIANFSLMQELFGYSHIDGVYWTLQVELFFYVIAAFAYFSGLLKRFSLFCLSWLLLSSILALVDRNGLSSDWTRILQAISIAKYAPLFMLGMIAHRCQLAGRLSREHAALAALCVLAHFSNWLLTAGIVAIASFVLLLLSNRIRVTVTPLSFLGAISYPLYLIHQHLGYMSISELMKLGASLNQAILMTVFEAVFLAWAISRYVEAPGKRIILGKLKTRREAHQGERNARS